MGWVLLSQEFKQVSGEIIFLFRKLLSVQRSRGVCQEARWEALQ